MTDVSLKYLVLARVELVVWSHTWGCRSCLCRGHAIGHMKFWLISLRTASALWLYLSIDCRCHKNSRKKTRRTLHSMEEREENGKRKTVAYPESGLMQIKTCHTHITLFPSRHWTERTRNLSKLVPSRIFSLKCFFLLFFFFVNYKRANKKLAAHIAVCCVAGSTCTTCSTCNSRVDFCIFLIALALVSSEPAHEAPL